MTKPLKLNLGCGPHRLAGFQNLDQPEWRWQAGLPYEDATVDAVTISHALMYLPPPEWPAAFAEFYRVLKPGGIVRITEDNTEDPESERYGAGAWPDALALTGPKVIRKALREAGFVAGTLTASTSNYRDLSLLQAHHGDAPKVFFLEGRKPK